MSVKTGTKVTMAIKDITLDEAYFRLAASVFPLAAGEESTDNSALVAALCSNLMNLGYAPEAALVKNWMEADYDHLAAEGTALLKVIRNALGDTAAMRRPMYPNFPKQVAEASDAELLVNAFLHYFGDFAGLRIMPAYEKLIRPALPTNEAQVKTLLLGSDNDFKRHLITLLSSSQAFSLSQREIVASVANNWSDALMECLPATFSNKENLAVLGAHVLRSGKQNGEKFDFHAHFRTATDVLRLATALSDGDVSLASSSKFKSFNRSQRRLMLELINSASNPLDDMWLRRDAFKRLGERLHPREYAERYPTAAQAFAAVRDKNYIHRGFNSKVEALLADKPVDVDALVTLLEHRPGVFARRLGEALRASPNGWRKVLLGWDRVVDQVSTTVLLQVHARFVADSGFSSLDSTLDHTDRPPRMFLPKGASAKAQVVEDTRVMLPGIISSYVAASTQLALQRRFARLGRMGKVYLDPALEGIKVPFGVRSASRSLRTVGRGSSLPLVDGSTLRFFIHWKDMVDKGDRWSNRVDIDLSAFFLDDKFSYVGDVAYYNLRNGEALHSGDITSAPDGASEFVDVNIDSALKEGKRYVAMTVHNYTRQPFAEVPECFAGFMMRTKVGSGEVYEPSTVQDKVDLTSDGTVNTLFLFDLQERKAYWIDVAREGHSFLPNNAYTTSKQTSSLVEAIIHSPAANLFDLFSMHANSRGRVVSKREEADIVISVDGDISPFDVETILGEFVV